MSIFKLSFVLGIILEIYFSFSMNLVVFEIPLICKPFLNIGNQFAFTLLFPLIKIAFVNSFILILSINSISMNHVIFPLTFVNVPVIKNSKSKSLLDLKLVEFTLITQCDVRFIFLIFFLSCLFKNDSWKVKAFR